MKTFMQKIEERFIGEKEIKENKYRLYVELHNNLNREPSLEELQKAWDKKYEMILSTMVCEIRSSSILVTANLMPSEYHLCKDCNSEFGITKSEIEWFSNKGLNKPVRCFECRSKRKSNNKVV